MENVTGYLRDFLTFQMVSWLTGSVDEVVGNIPSSVGPGVGQGLHRQGENDDKNGQNIDKSIMCNE